jgi:hypothetical protein
MGTSTERREGAGLKAALCTGKPKAALFPTSADQSLTSKPEAALFVQDTCCSYAWKAAAVRVPVNVEVEPLRALVPVTSTV